MDQPFIPTSFWGVLFALSLAFTVTVVAAGAWARGEWTMRLTIAAAMVANLILTRAITAWAPDAGVPVLVFIITTMTGALCVWWFPKSKFAVTVACLYWAMSLVTIATQFDTMGYLTIISKTSTLMTETYGRFVSVEESMWALLEPAGFALHFLMIGGGIADIGTGTRARYREWAVSGADGGSAVLGALANWYQGRRHRD